MSDEETVPDDVAARIAWRVASVSGWPEWMQVPALGHEITPVVRRVMEALAAAGYEVVKRDDWEWGVRLGDGLVVSQGKAEGWCRDYVETAAENGRHDLRAVRRSVGRSPWEVAP